ncbi:hypothetical protein [Acidimangrovimonas pyrenivorans]|uniref:Sulfotransferase domain-containing protein n=1 Tax=Acidimangrovimonas pyrenivorans TaxID=2030798 RepID=A0ABV7AP76_9RHOB
MDRHLIIAGQGRAGTTLLYNMLRSTLQGFDLPPSERAARTLIDLPGSFCTKRPFDIFDMPAIFEANQGRKRIDLIVSLRDPRDILVSRHAKVPDDYFCSADAMYFVPGDRPPERTAPGLLAIHDLSMAVAESSLFPQGVFFLKYEDLVADPEAVQGLLEQGLGLRFSGRFGDFHAAEIPGALQGPLNGVRPVEAAEAKWRRPEHRARIIDQFTRFPALFTVLDQLGYETDRGWFEALCADEVAEAGVEI